MKRFVTVLVLGCVVSTVSMLPDAEGGERNQKTVLTFNQPVEIPGTVLQAGTYVFKIADFTVDRNTVQILSQDERKVYATVMTRPSYRSNPNDDTSIVLEERGAGAPPAIKKWFFRDRTYGHEFVYGKPLPKPNQLARTDFETDFAAIEIPTRLAEPTPVEFNPREPEPVVIAQHTDTEESDYLRLLRERQEEAAREAQEGLLMDEQIPAQSAMIRQLPRTGSRLPLIALAGVGLLIAGMGLRISARRTRG
ncbi:MAG: hypothetical protein GXX84_16345 [Acidobacteria bacterium]|nr:hypothetical protein [Acidobacteriota bacterium]